MKSRSFSLKPFPSPDLLPHLEITGDIARSSNKFSISYTLSGSLEEIVVPALEGNSLRKNGLWEETCFEFFLGPLNSDHYWEFNLSTSGHWNVYRFTSCREGMQEETAFAALPFTVLLHLGSLQLSLEVELDKIIPADQALKIGISAVIKTIKGGTTFWALTHPGPQADFHRKDAFIIDL
jgi:hypothetical protein